MKLSHMLPVANLDFVFTDQAAAQWNEGLDSVKVRQEQLRQVHAAQVKALQEEHHRQQEELLQVRRWIKTHFN